ncbi:HlyD family secretion protein [Sandaracinobacteroides saxicola]|uniref:HlyD family efflux transporter periplasmic adaptor subunit n=1 Tax=Sandaracinobacteroides saxicola TaxID=2759707 RepID=A0A7G5IFH0_9SPHN|nr:HlyD family efflux transporter periplasmic adaptor subunit [Sandaracinobacteroides saxicola]QMW22112.1 HlyD family efflux transporter periplasmic adaptor subunit [Sandaracinobacteroides saxicola]
MHSPVLLAQPLMDRVLSGFLGTVFIAGVTFCALAQYTRVQTARGEVTAASGFSAVVTDEGGVISELLVRPGQSVEKGEPLARLSRTQVVSEQGDTTLFSITQATQALANVDLRLRETEQAIAAARGHIAQMQRSAGISTSAATARRALSEQRRQVAAKRLEQLEALAKEGIVTTMAVDQARVQSMQLLQEASDGDLTINEIGRARDERVAALESRIRDLVNVRLTLATERLHTEKQLIDLRARQAVAIVAPAAGVVAAISVRPGQRIEAGHRAFAVARPSARLTVVLEVPSKAIGLIEAGQRVSLKYDAFPYMTFGLRYGRVVSVENASLESGQALSTDGRETDRKFLVEVLPEDSSVVAYGRERSLRVGMMLTADIQVERRSLLEWWLTPLSTLRERIG